MQRTVKRCIGDFSHLRAEHNTIVFIDCEIMRIEELVDVGRKGNAVEKCAQLSMGEGLDVAGLNKGARAKAQSATGNGAPVVVNMRNEPLEIGVAQVDLT